MGRRGKKRAGGSSRRFAAPQCPRCVTRSEGSCVLKKKKHRVCSCATRWQREQPPPSHKNHSLLPHSQSWQPPLCVSPVVRTGGEKKSLSERANAALNESVVYFSCLLLGEFSPPSPERRPLLLPSPPPLPPPLTGLGGVGRSVGGGAGPLNEGGQWRVAAAQRGPLSLRGGQW